MILSIFIAVWVVSFVLLIWLLKNWHERHRVEPDMFDVCLTFLPCINTICVFVFVYLLIEDSLDNGMTLGKRIAKRFFGICYKD